MTKLERLSKKVDGRILLMMLGGSRLRGNYNENSDYDYYVVYLPTKEYYVSEGLARGFATKAFQPFKDEEENALFMPINYFYNKLLTGDFTVYEMMGAIKYNRYTLDNEYYYIAPDFEVHMNDITYKNYLSLECFKRLLGNVSNILENLPEENMFNDETDMKKTSLAYAYLYEILSMLECGYVNLNSEKIIQLLNKIKYDKEFFNQNYDSILNNIKNTRNVLQKSMENEEENITSVFPVDFDAETNVYSFVNSIVKLVDR